LPSVEAMIVVLPEDDGPNSLVRSTVMVRMLPSTVISTFFVPPLPSRSAEYATNGRYWQGAAATRAPRPCPVSTNAPEGGRLRRRARQLSAGLALPGMYWRKGKEGERAIEMKCELEHANVTVLSLAEGVTFLTTAFPHFRVRGGGESDHGAWRKKWLHVGTDSVYVALEETTAASRSRREPHRETGINHVGFVVEDVEDIKQKMEAAGYTATLAEPHPPTGGP